MRKFKVLILGLISVMAVSTLFAQSDIESETALDYEKINEIYTFNNVVNFDSIVFNINKNPRVYWLLKSFAENDIDPQWSQTVYRFVPIRTHEAKRADGRDFWYSYPEVELKNSMLSLPNTPALYKMNTRNSRSEGYYYNLGHIFIRLINEGKINVYEHNVKKTEGIIQYTRFTHDQIMDVIADKTGIDIPKGKTRQIKEEDMEFASSQIVGYEFQELWYFDDRTGEYRKRIVALAPLIIDKEGNPYFLFTVSMEDLSPYLMMLYIQQSGRFNDFSVSYLSYFTKQMYSGAILRVPNAKGELLVDQIAALSEGATAEELRNKWIEESTKIENIVNQLDGKKSWAIPSLLQRMIEQTNREAEAAQKDKKKKQAPQNN